MTSRRWLGVAAAALAAQLLVLYWPRPDVPGGIAGLDLAVHALVFAAVAYPSLRAGLPAVPVLAVLAAHAVVSEVLQHTVVPGRSGDVTDLVADLVGLLLAAVAGGRPRADDGGIRPPSDLV